MSDQALREDWKETVRDTIRKGAELNVAFILMNVLATMMPTLCSGRMAARDIVEAARRQSLEAVRREESKTKEPPRYYFYNKL